MKSKLKNICDLINDKISVNELINANLQSAYISTENMLPDKGGITAPSSIPCEGKITAYMPNDVLVSNIRPYFKKIWFATNQGGCSNDVLVFRAKDNISPDFLHYILADNAFFDYSMKTSKGTKMPRGDKASIMEYEVPNIDYSLQIKSSVIPRLIDEKIMVNNKINENLELQAQAIFKSWFMDFDPFGGVMPEDWTEKSVYDLAEYINGAAFKKEEYSTEGLPIIKISELKNGITDSTQYCCVKKDEKYYFDNKSILFSWSGNPETSIDTFLWYRGKAILNQHTFRVVSKYNAPAFTYFLLKYLKPEFAHIASNKQTTGLGHVTVADLKRLQFSCSKKTIEEFEKVSQPLFDMIYNTYIESNRLAELRDTLLPKLMNGEIDVSEVKI